MPVRSGTYRPVGSERSTVARLDIRDLAVRALVFATKAKSYYARRLGPVWNFCWADSEGVREGFRILAKIPVGHVKKGEAA